MQAKSHLYFWASLVEYYFDVKDVTEFLNQKQALFDERFPACNYCLNISYPEHGSKVRISKSKWNVRYMQTLWSIQGWILVDIVMLVHTATWRADNHASRSVSRRYIHGIIALDFILFYFIVIRFGSQCNSCSLKYVHLCYAGLFAITH